MARKIPSETPKSEDDAQEVNAAAHAKPQKPKPKPIITDYASL